MNKLLPLIWPIVAVGGILSVDFFDVTHSGFDVLYHPGVWIILAGIAGVIITSCNRANDDRLLPLLIVWLITILLVLFPPNSMFPLFYWFAVCTFALVGVGMLFFESVINITSEGVVLKKSSKKTRKKLSKA